MKQIKLNKYHLGWKMKVAGVIAIVVLLVGLCSAILKGINGWFDSHTIQFNKVITIVLKPPIEIKEREVEVKEIVRVIGEIPNPVDLKTDTEKYIYEKFGIENYKLAIAVARAESGLREETFNINTNGTIDVGIFQINSIHFKKPGCSLKEVATMKGNVDCAYSIYQVSGFDPWVAFKSGSFIDKL